MIQQIYTHPYFGSLPYLEDIPAGLDHASAPLLVFLHGAGERGTDTELLYRQAIPKYLKEGLTLPCITVCPQCPEKYVWNDILPWVKDFLDFYITSHGIDRKRVSLTGISMGGFGTWAMAMTYPEMFCKLAPVCGGGMSWRAANIQAPVWAFHGDADGCVPVECSYQMVDAALANEKDARLTIFHKVDHNSWDPAYQTTKVLEWLCS